MHSGKPELRHHQQSFLPQTSLVLSATGSLELRLVSSAILEHTNNNTSHSWLGLVIVSNDRRTPLVACAFYTAQRFEKTNKNSFSLNENSKPWWKITWTKLIFRLYYLPSYLLEKGFIHQNIRENDSNAAGLMLDLIDNSALSRGIFVPEIRKLSFSNSGGVRTVMVH